MDLSYLNPELPLSALKAPFSADKALRIVLGHCLEPIILNAGRMAAGPYDDEHIHQLRVGLRRLRSALDLFDGWAALPEPLSIAPLNHLFRDLGRVRDQTVLRASLARLLAEAGAPPLILPSPRALPDPALRVRAPKVQWALLQLMAFVSQGASPLLAAPHGRTLDLWMARRLARWHRHIQREGKRFAELPESRRHALRKRVKTLRYGVEFVAALFQPHEVACYLKRLHALQDALGQYVDLSLTLKWLQEVLPEDPNAAFARGWLGTQSKRQGAACAKILTRFEKISPLRLS